jgi:hypothetical protein
LIPYAAFGRLRLADFLSAELQERADWEYMDDLWVGEGFGFTEFLRLEEDPEVVRSIALDLADLPFTSSAAVLGAVGLPLAPGMRAEEVTARLGSPDSVERYVTDRATYYFTCGRTDRYAVSCTVHETAGLTSVTVLTPTPRRLAVEDGDGEA